MIFKMFTLIDLKLNVVLIGTRHTEFYHTIIIISITLFVIDRRTYLSYN